MEKLCEALSKLGGDALQGFMWYVGANVLMCLIWAIALVTVVRVIVRAVRTFHDSERMLKWVHSTLGFERYSDFLCDSDKREIETGLLKLLGEEKK